MNIRVPPVPGSFLVLAFLACLVYLPACRADFIWDDDQYVIENATLRSAEGLKQIWFHPAATPQYYPLVFTCFWVEYHLWGLSPAGYHLINVILHGLNSGLLFLVLRRLRLPGAWLAAAIFALHPVHVESVAWVTERKNVLSGFFYLTSFLAFWRFSPPERDSRSGSWGWYLLSLVLFLAALFSKTVTCSLPAVIILVWWWQRGWPTKREILALLPMFVLGLLLALNTVRVEKHQVGAEGEDWNFTPVDRCLIAGRALWFYAGKLLWPHPLIFNYPRWHIDTEQPWQYLFPLAALLVLIGLLLARHRLGKGPLVACLIFAGTLVPALGFFNVYPMIFSFVADHFQYLASIPLLVLAVVGAHGMFRRWQVPANVSGSLAAGFFLLLGILTWKQCHVYQNVYVLWEDTLAKNPDSWLAHFNLGGRHLDDGHHNLALHHFQRTLDIKPHYSGAFYNWGKLLAQEKKYDQAEEKFQQALRYDSKDPVIFFSLGLLQAFQKNFQESLPFFEKALALFPDYPEANFHMGYSLLKVDRPREALPFLRKAVQLRPHAIDFRQSLDEALEKDGKSKARG